MCDHDPVLPVTPCTAGVHPDAGQFDEVPGVAPVARSCHGNGFTDDEMAKQLVAGVVIEVHGQ
jgi:hypothetical protein